MSKEIGTAIQRGNTVWVYDVNGALLFAHDGELMGFSGSTVSIRQGNIIMVYDASGSLKFTRGC